MKISAYIGPPYYFSEYFGTKIMNVKKYLGEKNSTRVLNKYFWWDLYPGRPRRDKIITIHIHVKLEIKPTSDIHGDLKTGLLKMNG